jgi:hypothetical protein
MGEPCLCGADDCPVCYPGRFAAYVMQQADYARAQRASEAREEDDDDDA